MPRISPITLIFAVAGLVFGGGISVGFVPQASFADETPGDAADATLTELEEPPTLAKITALVSQLSDDDYRVREPASTRLVRIGIAARPILTAALQSADVEVRHRASRILSIIVEEDFQARIRAFAADVNGEDNTRLPGWERFVERMSGDKHARALFVEMHRSESELLGVYRPGSNDEREISDVLSSRCLVIDEMPETEISLGTIATLLLIGSEPEVANTDKVDMLITKLIKRDTIAGGMRAKRTEPVLRKLLGDWVAKSTFTSNAGVSHTNLRLAMVYDLPEGLAPAVQILRRTTVNPGLGNTQLRMNAALAIGKLGDRTNLVVLEPLLKDKSHVRSTGPVNAAKKRGNVEVQMRDVVLAVMLHLSGQKLSDYGYRDPQKVKNYLFEPSSLVFADRQGRRAAMAKWKRWSAGSPPGQDKAVRGEADGKDTQG